MNRGVALLFLTLLSWGLLASVYCNSNTKEGDGDTLDDNINTVKTGAQTDNDSLAREEEAIQLDGLSISEMKDIREKAEHHSFQAEVDRMMTLIINSLYKNKEIFLREIISNASDALDKIRLLSLTDPSVTDTQPEFHVKIKAVREDHSIHIVDTGVGMTKLELLSNLGTVAKSGTADFMSKISDAKTETETSDLIGQFGVGFYSAFLVSDRVTVVSKSNDDDQYIWESDASSFSVIKDPRGNTLKRGTEIILHLKPEAEQYLEPKTLEELIRKYSQFINFPIYMFTTKTEMVEETPEETDPSAPMEEDEDVVIEEEKEKKEPKKVQKTVTDWKLINKVKPIWIRKPNEISDEEYTGFFEALTEDKEGPLTKIHFTAEGEVTFRSILYIPKVGPRDLHKNMYQMKEKIRLYVRRIFITDDFVDMLPFYLNFIRGIVDSDDLPLNVSRETLQQSKLLKLIKKKLIRKVLDMIKKIDDDDIDAFWREYGTNMKLGVVDDSVNRNRLAKLIRFHSSFDPEKYTTLVKYIERMKKNQKNIFFIAGDDYGELKKSPLVEKLLKRGYEVLYCIDPVDEYALNSILDFEGLKFQNVAKEGTDSFFDNSEKTKERKAAQVEEFTPLMDWLKDNPLSEVVEKVTLSDILADSPCAVLSPTYGVTGNMEKIAKSQAYKKGIDVSPIDRDKRVFQINPFHPIIKELKARVSDERKDDEMTGNMVKMMYDTALLRSGYAIHDTASFASRVERLIRVGFDIPSDEKVDDDMEVEEVSTKEDNAGEESDEKKTEL